MKIEGMHSLPFSGSKDYHYWGYEEAIFAGLPQSLPNADQY